MIVIRARNVHEALPKALDALLKVGIKRESRNGPVLVFPEPVTTVYEKPLERVVFWPERDCNPFFHFAESLWMLAGRNDVSFLTRYVPRMKDFSDNGEVFHGAYGYRWRHHFLFDQLHHVINNLAANPDDRRQVVSMWDAEADLQNQRGKKDLPCNLQALFSISHQGNVDMLVTNRSNDLILGCYGANAVHFSYLHEFVARALKLPVGTYRQVSNNLHAYCNNDLEKCRPLVDQREQPQAFPYLALWEGAQLCSTVYSLMSKDYLEWLGELNIFLSAGAQPGMDPFFRRVAQPILRSHAMWSQKKDPDRFVKAMDALDHCVDGPWTVACKQWLQRRQERILAQRNAADDGVVYE